MEEKEEKFKVDTEELKNETVETAKKVKESIKGANIKEETKATKGFVVEMFKNPLEKIKEVALDNSGKFFKTALFLLIIWTVVVFIEATYSTIHYWGIARVFKNILSVLKEILAPAIGILVSALIVLVLNKNNKKSLITTPFAKICSAISIVLGYFGFKYLFEEDDNTFIKKYVLIQTVYYVAYIVIRLLGIYI